MEALEDRTVPTALPLTGPNGGAWVKIDTITIGTKTKPTVATGVQSNVVLDAGVTYLAVASGTARIATDGTGFTDAEYIRYNKNTGPQEVSSPGYAWNNHGVRLNGVDGGNTAGNFWGSYQADHQYVREVTGQGTLLRGWYSDIPGYYGDNSGALQVDIYAEVPEGTGIIGGIVWQDEVVGNDLPGNGDGIRQDYEPVVNGVEVELLDQAGDVVATAASNSSGAYRFAGIPLGEYRVRFTLAEPMSFSPQDQGAIEGRDSDADLLTGLTDSIFLTAAQPAKTGTGAGVKAPPTSDTLTWDHFRKLDERPKDAPQTVDAETAVFYDPRAKFQAKAAGGTFVATFTTEFTITAKFAQFSWVLKGQDTDTLLAHEKLHLKIHEYVATKAKLNIPQMTGKGATAKDAELDLLKQLGEFKKKWETVDKAVQDKYDAETNHGKKADPQADWAKDYAKYADKIIEVNGWKIK